MSYIYVSILAKSRVTRLNRISRDIVSRMRPVETQYRDNSNLNVEAYKWSGEKDRCCITLME